jgi:cis-L-3-hydroxyproline dehydratase
VRISRVEVYGYDLRYAHGDYVMSDGRRTSWLPSTLVCLTTDDGPSGWGEVCPLGPTYLEGFSGGARAALAELAPAVLGADPRNLHQVRERMDAALRGHAYAKSAIDVACWDILGRVSGLPVSTLLGGARQERFLLYESIPLAAPEAMARQMVDRKRAGIRHFQIKVGDDPRNDIDRVRATLEVADASDRIVVDANGGWRLQDAMIAARGLEQFDGIFLEQPCPTLEECLHLRRYTNLPMVLDEIITDVQSLLRAWHAGGLEAFNLKISKVGGLSNARLLRDLATSLGLGVTIEDTWGGDVTTAAVSHLAASTSADTLFTVSFMNDWVRDHAAGYQPRSEGGFGAAPTGPGLGIDVDPAVPGTPLFTFEN